MTNFQGKCDKVFQMNCDSVKPNARMTFFLISSNCPHFVHACLTNIYDSSFKERSSIFSHGGAALTL